MKQPLYRKLYRQLREEIESGHMEEGMRLPSIRQMIQEIGASRTTVEAAYEQLCADGLVSCIPQSGYYVNRVPNRTRKPPAVATPASKQEYRYDFSGRRMDPKLFDFDIWRKLSRAVLQDSTQFLGYGDQQGEYVLREQIAKYLSAGRGVYTAPENIVISAGIQSLLSLLCEIFEKSEQCIAFENPGFRKGHRVFADHGYRSVFIQGGENGIDLEQLRASGANMLYLSPSHSFPSGRSLTHRKRVELLQWAQETQAVIFEDDYDGELRYSGKPLATLTALDTGENVIYLGAFSKLLPPSIRISYAVLPDRLLPLYQQAASRYNQTSSTMEQLTLARFIEEGRLEKQIRRLRRLYANKNILIEQAFTRYFGDRAVVWPNDTGLHMVVSLRCDGDSAEMCRRAEQAGIRLVPMSTYQLTSETEIKTEFYLSSAGIAETDIDDAIRLLHKVWMPEEGRD